MPILTGLPGVRKARKIEAAFGQTPTDFVKLLRTHRAVAAPGDDGCVTVYIDDKGIKRGYFSRYLQDSHWKAFESDSELQRWLKAMLPMCHGARAA